MKDINEMEFIELLEWAREVDWEEVTMSQWNEYVMRCEELAPKYFRGLNFLQLEEFYNKYVGENIDPWFDAWDYSVRNSYPLSTLFDEIRAIKTTLKIIMDEIGDEPANITVEELNRLKGGI